MDEGIELPTISLNTSKTRLDGVFDRDNQKKIASAASEDYNLCVIFSHNDHKMQFWLTHSLGHKEDHEFIPKIAPDLISVDSF